LIYEALLTAHNTGGHDNNSDIESPANESLYRKPCLQLMIYDAMLTILGERMRYIYTHRYS